MGKVLEVRKAALLRQFAALPEELKRWIALSEPAGAFEKHQSQIAALAAQMAALNERVQKEWGGALDFSKVQAAQLRCAAVQTVWNYFREKLLLRRDEFLGSPLKAADYYAWSCYLPMIKARGTAESHREPPLVTFHGDVSPSALSRQTLYEAGGDKTGTTNEEPFARVREALPIPIIGIPWALVKNLPDLALLAHETGHIVEADFELSAAVAKAIAAAVPTSALRNGWSENWRAEVFADLFACFAAGPSFVWALLAALPDSPGAVANRRRPADLADPVWMKYPAAGLRVLLNLEALRQHGFIAEADEIGVVWDSDYPNHAMREYEGDLPKVVKAFYEGAALPTELKYPQERESAALWAANNGGLTTNASFDPRVLVAVAGRIARTGTGGPTVEDAWERLQQHIVNSRPAGVLAEAMAPADTKPRLRTGELWDLLLEELDDESSGA